MATDGISVVLLDLGRVMVDFDHRIGVRRIRQFTDVPEDDIFDFFFDSGLTRCFEEGGIAPEDFFAQVKRHLDLRLDYEGFVPIWSEIFFLTEKNRRVHEIARSLRGRYTVALLSNINVLHFEYIRRAFDIFGMFDRVFASFQMKVQKPDPRIYRMTLEALGVPADSVFYADDRAELVDAAGKLGIRSFVFTGPEQLERDLVREGILLQPGLQPKDCR